jgi:Fe-S-cluster containining protein
MKYTRLLRFILSSYKESLNTEEYLSFERHIHTSMNKIIQELSALKPGVERGRRIQELIDIEVDQNTSSKVTCKKGCSNCCHLNIEITSDDAAVAINGMMILNYQLDPIRFSEHARREGRDEKWNRGVIPENKCLFLNKEGACAIYHFRPSVCRKVLVTNDPKECADIKGQLSPIYMPKVEIIISAALNLEGNKFASLAQMVNEQLCLIKNEPVNRGLDFDV